MILHLLTGNSSHPDNLQCKFQESFFMQRSITFTFFKYEADIQIANDR